MNTAASPVTAVQSSAGSQMLLYQTLYCTSVRGNDNAIETSLKAVGSLQRCINIKTPALHFDFEVFILLFHFNGDSLNSLTEHGHFSLPFTRLESTDSPIKSRLYRRLYIILTIICICNFQANAD